jgi:type VI secretion system secreted protein VgrG
MTTYKYGKQKIFTQTYLEGDDNWASEGKSWHWQPVMADDIYESKGK